MTALIAEFVHPNEALAAARKVRHLGPEGIELHSPFELSEFDEIVGRDPGPVAKTTLFLGALGGIAAYLIQWWTTAWDYPLNVGALPLDYAVGYIPLVFETTVLCAGIGAFVAFFAICGLPRLWSRFTELRRSDRVSVDLFVLIVPLRDAEEAGEDAELWQTLREEGAVRIERVEDLQ